MKRRDPKKDGELQQAAQDVTYEIVMLIESACRTGATWSSPPTTPPQTERTIALESFLLHFRNLRAFLCPFIQGNPPRGDDILASDFLGKPPQDIADASEISSDKERLDRMLAHLSYSRAAYTWEVRKMALAMLDQVRIFIARLPEERKGWFPDSTVLSQGYSLISAWVPGDLISLRKE